MNMQLTLNAIVKINEDVRSTKDQRKRVDTYIVSYQGTDGNEYRKSFETQRGIPVNVPNNGTHESLAKVKYQ
jgi:hypothetical protein